MRYLDTNTRGFVECRGWLLAGHRATPARQQLAENGLNLGEDGVIAEPVCGHQLPLAVLIQPLKVGGDSWVAGVAQRAHQLGDDGRNAADCLASLDYFATPQEGSRQDSSFEGAFIQNFDEAGRISGQNPRLKVLGVVVGQSHHSDHFIAFLSTDLNHFGAAVKSGPEQEQA